MNNTEKTTACAVAINEQSDSEDNNIEGTTKDVVFILKRSASLFKKANTMFEEHGKMLSAKFAELDLYIHALERIPSVIGDQIMATVPVITKEITVKHMQYLEEFKQHINSCNHAIDVTKAKLDGIQYWYYKKTFVTIGIATIIAILASISTTYVMFKNNPPRHETRILKANTVQSDGTVHVFDMTGKFCSKITTSPKGK